MATNNSANIVTAAAGKVLQGAGVGVNCTFSTPTYPSTSGSSGKVLISDGTNNVYSTPTFPNASATSGKIIKSDGTNWLASTETYAAPGTSGNVMTSDGTNWTSAAASGKKFSVSIFGNNGLSPADATTYYIGNAAISTTLATVGRIVIPLTGTINTCYVTFFTTGAGSAQTSTISLRLNNTTDTTISSTTVQNAATTTFSSTSMAMAVTAGDFVNVKWVTPTWVTNPTGVQVSVSFVVD